MRRHVIAALMMGAGSLSVFAVILIYDYINRPQLRGIEFHYGLGRPATFAVTMLCLSLSAAVVSAALGARYRLRALGLFVIGFLAAIPASIVGHIAWRSVGSASVGMAVVAALGVCAVMVANGISRTEASHG